MTSLIDLSVLILSGANLRSGVPSFSFFFRVGLRSLPPRKKEGTPDRRFINPAVLNKHNAEYCLCIVVSDKNKTLFL